MKTNAENAQYAANRYHELAEKLKNEEDLSFEDQCVLFMAVISRPGVRITKQLIAPVIDNTIIWGKLQHMLKAIYANAEGCDVQKWKSELFGEEFKKQCQAENKASKHRVDSLTKTYIIRKQGTTEVKIGKSIQVEKRVRTLKTQSGAELEVLAIIPKNIESMLHKQFAELRTVGEWFDDSKGLIAAFAKKQSEGVAA